MRILITGAGSGIGKGLAQALAAEGHSLLVTDLRQEAAESAAEEIRAAGGEADARVLDVSDAASIAALEGESVDVLINNAGLQHVAPIEEFPPEKFDLLIQVMLTGAAMLTRAVLPGMREQGFGRVINIGSIHSLIASPYKSAYVAAKHGLLGFSKVVALETADTDITINTVCPSYVLTPLVEQQIAGQAKSNGISEQDVIDEIMLKPMPKKAFISIDELAGVCTFLVSAAARNITGQTITVDGGWTAR